MEIAIYIAMSSVGYLFVVGISNRLFRHLSRELTFDYGPVPIFWPLVLPVYLGVKAVDKAEALLEKRKNPELPKMKIRKKLGNDSVRDIEMQRSREQNNFLMKLYATHAQDDFDNED